MPPDDPIPAGLSAGREFLTTRWNMVLIARDQDAAACREALEHLCRAYWFPLYAFVRRKGFEPEDAQDLTQAFFARLLERKLLDQVSPEKGRFRSFLMASLQHFISDELDRANALKRGGGQRHLHLDTTNAEALYARELANQESPEKEFDRRWALAILERAQKHLRDECVESGRLAYFEALGPARFGGAADDSHEAIALRLGTTVSAVKSAAFRLRHRYRELIREEIAETVSTPAQIEEELRHLLAVLGS